MADRNPVTIIGATRGMNNTIPRHLLPGDLLQSSRNITFRKRTLQRRQGFRLLEWPRQFTTTYTAILPYALSAATGALFSNGARISKIQNLTTTLVASGLSAGTTWRGHVYDSDRHYLVNGHDKPRVFGGASVLRQMGIEPPISAPNATCLTGSGLSGYDGWSYKYKFADSSAADALRSTASPILTTASAICSAISVAVTASPQSNAAWKRIYRTIDGGTDFYFISAISGTSYADTTTDADLVLNIPMELTTGGNPLEALPPVAKFLCEVPNLKRMFMAGAGVANGVYDAADISTLYWSQEGLPEYFVATNAETLDFNITALHPIDSRILVFSPDSTQTLMLAGGTTMVQIARDEFHGCDAPDSVVSTDFGVVFLDGAHNDVCLTVGNRATPIGCREIRATLQGLNRAQLKLARGMYYPDWKEYWLSVPDAGKTKNTTILVCDLNGYPNSVSWWQMTGIYAQALAMAAGVVDATDTEYPLYGDDYGRAYRLDAGWNDGMGTVGASAAGLYFPVVSGYATSASITNPTASFQTSGGGLMGREIYVLSGTGSGQTARISSNSGTVLTLEEVWTTNPNSTSYLILGGNDFYAKTRALSFGVPTREKSQKTMDVAMNNVTLSGAKMTFRAYDNMGATAVKTGSISLSKIQDRVGLQGVSNSLHHEFEFEQHDPDAQVEIIAASVEMEGIPQGVR